MAKTKTVAAKKDGERTAYIVRKGGSIIHGGVLTDRDGKPLLDSDGKERTANKRYGERNIMHLTANEFDSMKPLTRSMLVEADKGDLEYALETENREQASRSRMSLMELQAKRNALNAKKKAALQELMVEERALNAMIRSERSSLESVSGDDGSGMDEDTRHNLEVSQGKDFIDPSKPLSDEDDDEDHDDSQNGDDEGGDKE